MATDRATTAEQSRQVVTDLLAARDAGDADTVNALLSDDATFQLPGSTSPDRHGREEVATQLLTAANKIFGDTISRTYHDIIADAGIVAVTQTATGTTLDGGIDYENEYVFVYYLRDGKVQSIIEHADTLRAARIFGRV
jgi:uncharacterized protein